MSAQLWATVRGTMARNSDGHDDPWHTVFVGLPAARSVVDSPAGVLPVLQQALCSLPVLVVARVLGIGELWLHHRRLRRIIPLAEGQRCMAVLIGPKQLALVEGNNAHGRVALVLRSLLYGDDNVPAEARLRLDPLHVEPVVEAPSSGQRVVLAPVACPAQAGVDVSVDVMHDYG